MSSIRYLSLSVAVSLLSSTAAAQIAGTPSSVARLAPVDASALGVNRGANVGVSIEGDPVLQGGVGIASGSLRGLLAGSKYEWTLGAGYARTLAGMELINGIHTSIGGELVGAFRYDRGGPYNGGGLHLTIPAALTLGDPNRPLMKGPALALYAAPYAELGSIYRHHSLDCLPTPCLAYGIRRNPAFATGMGVGSRVSFGRFAADFLIREFLARDYLGHHAVRDFSLGIDYRLGE